MKESYNRAVKPLRVIVCGAAGRMGSRVAALAAGDERFALAGCLVRQAQTQSPLAPTFSARELPGRLANADALIDFSSPEACAGFAAQAADARKTLVCGTTGLSQAQRRALERAAARTAVLYAANFSAGVAVLCALAREAARRLPAWDRGVVETHHKAKKDAPSGTALRLSKAAGEAPILSQRLGDVVGEHTLTLAGPLERLELTHRAHSRDVFALGALEAALWLRGRKPGFYGMDDLLELA